MKLDIVVDFELDCIGILPMSYYRCLAVELCNGEVTIFNVVFAEQNSFLLMPPTKDVRNWLISNGFLVMISKIFENFGFGFDFELEFTTSTLLVAISNRHLLFRHFWFWFRNTKPKYYGFYVSLLLHLGIHCIFFACTFHDWTFIAEISSPELSSPCKFFPWHFHRKKICRIQLLPHVILSPGTLITL